MIHPRGAPLKPVDHPEFFRSSPPDGRSRESSIVLDADGVFWHEGRRVEHPGLRRALDTWIRRHPDDGRYVLCNGYDWTYFTVVDVPYRIRRVWQQGTALWGELSDGTREPLDLGALRSGARDALYVPVKGGLAEARLTQHAQSSLHPFVVETPEGSLALKVAGVVYPLRGA